MRRLFSKILMVAALLTSPVAARINAVSGRAAAATTAPPEQRSHPALWVVKDADTTIYLFGTVHRLLPGPAWFDGAVKSAFDRSDTLAIEHLSRGDLNIDDAQKVLDFSQTPLTEQLGHAAGRKFTTAMKTVGLPAEIYDHAQPWFAFFMLMASAQEVFIKPKSEPGVEDILLKKSEESKKPIVGMEGPSYVLSELYKLKDVIKIVDLKKLLNRQTESFSKFNKEVEMWRAGNQAVMADFFKRDDAAINEIIIADRNKLFVSWIKQRLKTPGTAFVAVGAAHLVGPNSVQAQLAADRIIASRVEN